MVHRRRRSGIRTRTSAFALAFVLGTVSWLLSSRPGLASDFLKLPTAGLKGVDLDGRLHRFGEADATKALVVVFLSTECPISNNYVPLLNRLAARYRRRGVECYGVISDPSVKRARAIEHRDEYHIAFPVIFDASGELRRSLSPTHTPQGFVLGPRGRQLYSGLIDDEYVDLGRKKIKANKPFLEDALISAIADEPVAVEQTEPIGCLLELPARGGKTAEVTFSRDIAPVIYAHCATCHRPGQSAPFPLLTYEDVSRHARQIAAVTRSRFMPPWKPVSGFAHFRDERRLSDHEIALFDMWVEAGKPQGDPVDSPPPPEFTDGWRLGMPDLVLTMGEDFALPARGPDIHQHFVIPTRLREDRMIAAVEFRPGNGRVVHHASFYLDTTGAAHRLDIVDPDVGYGSFPGPGFENEGSLRSWLPGMSPRRLPAGMGRPVARRSDLIMEIHYQCSGKPERDRSTIGIHFAPRSAKQLVMELQILNTELEIPKDVRRHHHQASYTLPVETILLDVVPHMHLLGREMKATATLPDGRVEPLVWVKDWDFNWQGQYTYARPVRLPEGTRIDVDTWYDNSAGNPQNPNSPPKTVYWGYETTDEMDICHFHCTCDSLSELLRLRDDYVEYHRKLKRRLRQAERRRAAR